MGLRDDPASFAAVIASIYDCVLDPARWPPLLAEVAALIGGRRAALAIASSAQPSRIALTHNLPDATQLARCLPLNPLLPLALAQAPDRPVVASRDIGLVRFQQTRFYRDAVAPLGDLDLAAVLVTREADGVGHVLMTTPAARGPVSAQDAAELEAVAPHLRRALRLAELIDLQRSGAEAHGAALRALEAPLLILDARGHPVFVNPAAVGALAEGSVLRLRDGRLRGATDAAERALRRALAAPSAGLELPVGAPDGDGHLIFVARLGMEADRLFGTAAGGALLLAWRRAGEPAGDPLGVATRLFGLTPAQAQVLAGLLRGQAPEAIATDLRISVTTVRTHLAALFRRTGTTRQAELVARVLSFGSPLRRDVATD
jgi:DNA-binding CsgD family transcriptional regulator